MIRRREWTAADLDALEARIAALEEAIEDLEQMTQSSQPGGGGDDLDKQLKQLLIGLLASRAVQAPPPGGDGGAQR